MFKYGKPNMLDNKQQSPIFFIYLSKKKKKNLHFSRRCNDWELVEVETFIQKLHALSTRREVLDKLSWNETKCGNFSFRSPHASLTKGDREPFSARVVWRMLAPTKASFFSWEVPWGRTLMLGQLKRRGWTIPNRYFCAKLIRRLYQS